MSKIVNEKVERLADAFLSLSDREECLSFFEDLFTGKEITELSARLEVAKLLKAKVNYIDIATLTGASTATISRVSKSLAGNSGGYKMVLSRLDEKSGEDSSILRLDTLEPEEAEAIRAVVACMKAKKAK